MIDEFGGFALVLGLALSLAQAVLSGVGRWRRSLVLTGAGEGAAMAAFVSVALAFAALMHAFTQGSWKAEMKPAGLAGSVSGYGDAVAVIPVHGILTRRPDDMLEFLYGNTSYEAIRDSLKKTENTLHNRQLCKSGF